MIFIEPYNKSRFEQLYSSEIRLTNLTESRARPLKSRVDFVPYVGISPRRFDELFAFVPRKQDDLPGADRTLSGLVVDWNSHRSTATVRESIITESAHESIDRLRDVLSHERDTIDKYDAEAFACLIRPWWRWTEGFDPSATSPGAKDAPIAQSELRRRVPVALQDDLEAVLDAEMRLRKGKKLRDPAATRRAVKRINRWLSDEIG